MLSDMPIRSGTLSSFVVFLLGERKKNHRGLSLAERFQSFAGDCLPLRGKQSPASKRKHLAAAGKKALEKSSA
jgi:hypothetical protein